MKMTGFQLEAVAVLATLTWLSIFVPTLVTEFFPLAIWEEMETWEQTQLATLDRDIARDKGTRPMGAGDADMVEASFPFDVWEESDDIGGIDWSSIKNWNAFHLNYGTVREDTTRP